MDKINVWYISEVAAINQHDGLLKPFELRGWDLSVVTSIRDLRAECRKVWSGSKEAPDLFLTSRGQLKE